MGAQRSQSLSVYSQLASHQVPADRLLRTAVYGQNIFLHSSGSASNETVLKQDLVGFGGAGAPFPASVNEVSFHHHHRHQNSHAIHGNHHNSQTYKLSHIYPGN